MSVLQPEDLDAFGLSLDLSRLGISSYRHFLASTAVILVSFAFFTMHSNGGWFKAILFGDRQLKEKGGCPVNMDVITGMGICVYRELGWLGFLLFSGLSIIPRRITLGDVIMRLCAGIYLRTMSGHFQRFAGHYRCHWAARAAVVAAAASTGQEFWHLVGLALASTAIIFLFEVGIQPPKGGCCTKRLSPR